MYECSTIMMFSSNLSNDLPYYYCKWIEVQIGVGVENSLICSFQLRYNTRTLFMYVWFNLLHAGIGLQLEPMHCAHKLFLMSNEVCRLLVISINHVVHAFNSLLWLIPCETILFKDIKPVFRTNVPFWWRLLTLRVTNLLKQWTETRK